MNGRRMAARFSGKCFTCGGRIEAGEEIVYDGKTNHVLCRTPGSPEQQEVARRLEALSSGCAVVALASGYEVFIGATERQFLTAAHADAILSYDGPDPEARFNEVVLQVIDGK